MLITQDEQGNLVVRNMTGGEVRITGGHATGIDERLNDAFERMNRDFERASEQMNRAFERMGADMERVSESMARSIANSVPRGPTRVERTPLPSGGFIETRVEMTKRTKEAPKPEEAKKTAKTIYDRINEDDGEL